jgi:hypothetical protein
MISATLTSNNDNSMTKILQPKGKAIFIEPLGHNFLINLYRRLTPNIRSADEHPLLAKDLKIMALLE